MTSFFLYMFRFAVVFLEHPENIRLLRGGRKKKGSLRIENTETVYLVLCSFSGRPGSSEVPRNPLTRWDASSIPANGIFLTRTQKKKKKMPNGWRTIKSLVHRIRLHGRRGKGMAESFSREKFRHAPQKEGG